MPDQSGAVGGEAFKRIEAVSMDGQLQSAVDESAITVTLRFKSRADRDRFMGGLSDGFGESVCALEWPREQGVSFADCDTFDVTVFHDDENGEGRS